MNTTARSTVDDGANSRRRPRHAIAGVVEVTDCMTERTVGMLGNLSETGMLLIAKVALVDDALYQFRFQLDGPAQQAPIEVGAHLLWQDHANAPGQTWAGLRFINLPEPHRQRLRDWLARPARAS